MNDTDCLVLDMRRINWLSAGLDSPSHAIGVVSRFVERLPGRLGSMHLSLRDGKGEAALGDILSVATSAYTTGATQLEEQSRVVEQRIRAGDLAAALVAAQELDAYAADFAQQVSAVFNQPLSWAGMAAPLEVRSAA